MSEAFRPIETAWRSAIKDLFKARSSGFLGGMIAPIVFWLLALFLSGLLDRYVVSSAMPLLFLLALAIASNALQRGRRASRHVNWRLIRLNTLINVLYVGLFLLTISVYSLLIALAFIHFEMDVSSAVARAMLILYILSAIAAVVWSPRSIPRSRIDDETAQARDRIWLPWLLGIQGSLVGLGVLLGALVARTNIDWGGLLIGGLAYLGSLLMITFAILILYRFLILALHPIPLEVQDEFGIRS